MINKRAQSFLEYAVLIIIIVAATIAMQQYIKRGIQGKLRENSDQFSDSAYSPGATTGTYNVTTETHEHVSSANDTSIANITANTTVKKYEKNLSFSDEPERE